MRISIITVCLNSEVTIKRTIESVLAQTFDDFEYLIIDGASTDKTLMIVDKYRDSFNARNIPYYIYSEKDNGIYDAMNKGIKKAKGEIIGILNSDDWYEPTALETIARLYERDRFDVCMCSLYLWRKRRKIVKKPRVRTFKTTRDLCHPSMFVTRDTYKCIGVYNKKFFYSDLDFWLRTFRHNVKMTVSKDVITNYTIGGVSNQKTFSKMGMRMRDRYRIYRYNHYSRFYFFECVLIEVAKLILA